MIAIRTRYYGPTNTKGSRIVADAGRGRRVTIGYPHELSGAACYALAAEALCKKMGWAGELVGGGYDDGGSDYYWCFLASDRANVPTTDTAPRGA